MTSESRYVTIGSLWECRECEVEGKRGVLGRAVHDLRNHRFSNTSERGQFVQDLRWAAFVVVVFTVVLLGVGLL